MQPVDGQPLEITRRIVDRIEKRHRAKNDPTGLENAIGLGKREINAIQMFDDFKKRNSIKHSVSERQGGGVAAYIGSRAVPVTTNLWVIEGDVAPFRWQSMTEPAIPRTDIEKIALRRQIICLRELHPRITTQPLRMQGRAAQRSDDLLPARTTPHPFRSSRAAR